MHFFMHFEVNGIQWGQVTIISVNSITLSFWILEYISKQMKTPLLESEIILQKN